MPTTANFFVSYTDLVDGYTERYTPGAAEAVRVCQVEWAERGLFVAAMLGYSQKAGNVIQRFLPESHPEADWFYACEAELVRGVGVPGQGGTNNFLSYGSTAGATDGYAVYNVRYRPLLYDVASDAVKTAADTELVRFVERSRTYSVENLTIQAGTWKWSTGGAQFHEQTTKLFGSEELTYVWHDVPDLPSQLTATIGKVNDGAFDLFAPDGAYSAETLLCLPPQVERTTNPFGNVTYKITYKFLHRSTGWNNFYRPDLAGGPGFDGLVANDGSGVKPYVTDDFDDLFIMT